MDVTFLPGILCHFFFNDGGILLARKRAGASKRKKGKSKGERENKLCRDKIKNYKAVPT